MINMITLLCLFLGVVACNANKSAPVPDTLILDTKATQLNISKSDDIRLLEDKKLVVKNEWKKATIKRLGFEGGFWGIETHTGEKLLPMNLSKEYRQENLNVLIQGKSLEGVMTIHQWGTPFEISDIKMVDKYAREDEAIASK